MTWNQSGIPENSLEKTTLATKISLDISERLLYRFNFICLCISNYYYYSARTHTHIVIYLILIDLLFIAYILPNFGIRKLPKLVIKPCFIFNAPLWCM